ncbi:hypothetical protein CBI55_21530 [Pseudomonas syringae]|uniref:hypothetical protein n=1 Tax=Pseudomonas syringae TaxID=317 RepID=UPI000447F038|nr:hypothetical protein [Pseudomonas syringae]EXL31044.1 hypothetical protein PssB301D_02921 [Pseudomonas syringae pv. syringae str. B301D-R]PIO91968.1 hypothetical protein CBI55_21530 [Pseudomonas syringae]
MNDDEERIESLSARLKERQMAEKFKIHDVKNKLEQAQAITLRLLDGEHRETENVEDILAIADTCATVLADCVQVLGIGDLEITATFPDAKMPTSKLS